MHTLSPFAGACRLCHTRLPTSLFDAFPVIMRVSRQWLWLSVICLYPEEYACTVQGFFPGCVDSMLACCSSAIALCE